jgi:hypothetical protein
VIVLGMIASIWTLFQFVFESGSSIIDLVLSVKDTEQFLPKTSFWGLLLGVPRIVFVGSIACTILPVTFPPIPNIFVAHVPSPIYAVGADPVMGPASETPVTD